MVTSESRSFAGLCSTCNNSPTCFYRARRGPALFCELFDDYSPPGSDGGERVSAALKRSGAAGGDADVSAHGGLCINCEHRWSCAHPRPPGGVWHCEDYE